MRPIYYMDYDKVTDILIYFSKEISLRFTVRLSRKDKNGMRRFFHSEVSYNNEGNQVINIKRDISFYFHIEDIRDYKSRIVIGPEDIFFLKMLLEKNVIPWYIGNSGLYSTDKDGKIILVGKYVPQQLSLSDFKYLEFHPIVLTDEQDKTSYGVRMMMSSPESYVDINLNMFMAFYNIITNTDCYTLASTMLCYAKTEPYGINKYDMANQPRNFFER